MYSSALPDFASRGIDKAFQEWSPPTEGQRHGGPAQDSDAHQHGEPPRSPRPGRRSDLGRQLVRLDAQFAPPYVHRTAISAGRGGHAPLIADWLADVFSLGDIIPLSHPSTPAV